MNKTRVILQVVGLGLLLALGACGGGGGGGGAGGGGGGGGEISSTSISVTPALGAFGEKASVQAFDSTGKLLASGTTDVNGRVSSLAIPTSHKGVVILRVSGAPGAQYFDEGKGSWQSLAETDRIYSVLPAAAIQSGASFGVTPLTNLLSGLLGLDTAASTPSLASAKATDAEVEAVKQRVELMTGVSLDVLSAPDPLKDLGSAKDASKPSALYGVLLAEMARQARLRGGNALQQAQQLLTNARSTTQSADLEKLQNSVSAVSTAIARLQGNALLNTANGSAELNKLIAGKEVAKPVSEVIGVAINELTALKVKQETERTSTVAVLSASKDIQGIWDTAVGASSTGSALITADRHMILRLSVAGGGSRLLLAQLKPSDSGYSAIGHELVMQNNLTTVSDKVSLGVTVDNANAITLTLGKSGQTETFNLAYQSRYEEKVELSQFAGTWSDILGDLKVTLKIESDGSIKGTSSSSCTWSGTVATRGEAKSVADVLMTESCPGASPVELVGVATFKPGSNKSVLRFTLTNKTYGKALLLEMVKS